VLLLAFFHPVVTSVRGWQPPPTRAKVQERRGGRRTALPPLRAAAYVCAATLWHEVLPTLGPHRRPPLPLAEHAALAPLRAVAGRRLPAWPRMAWALWQDDQHRAAKRPAACAVLRQGPGDVTGTAGNGAARAAGRRLGPPGGFSVVDRGYADSRLWHDLHALPCSFLWRVQANAAYEGQETRALAPAAVHAGVGDAAVRRRWGTAHQTRVRPPPFRVVRLATGKTRQDGPPDVWGLVTHRRALAAALRAVA
jgi:hypothetical protein